MGRGGVGWWWWCFLSLTLSTTAEFLEQIVPPFFFNQKSLFAWEEF
jgi:hypothetical protein